MTETIRFYSAQTKKLLFVTDQYLSLTVEEEFRGPGRFEAVLPLSGIPRVEVETMILLRGVWFVAESVQQSPKEGTSTVSGRGILSYFARRIIPEHTVYYRTAEDTILLLSHAYGTASVPGSYRVTQSGGGPHAEHNIPPSGLLSAMHTIAEAGGRGLRMDYAPHSGVFTFSVPAPRDRTLTSGTDPVLLSTHGGTLLSPQTETDVTSYKNSVLVRGKEKEDGTFFAVTVHAADCGFADGFDDSSAAVREAILQPALALSPFYTEDGIFRESAYLDSLRVKGEAYLAAHRPKRSISGEVPPAVAESLGVGELVSLFYEGVSEKKLVTKKEYRVTGHKKDVRVTLTDAAVL